MTNSNRLLAHACCILATLFYAPMMRAVDNTHSTVHGAPPLRRAKITGRAKIVPAEFIDGGRRKSVAASEAAGHDDSILKIKEWNTRAGYSQFFLLLPSLIIPDKLEDLDYPAYVKHEGKVLELSMIDSRIFATNEQAFYKITNGSIARETDALVGMRIAQSKSSCVGITYKRLLKINKTIESLAEALLRNTESGLHTCLVLGGSLYTLELGRIGGVWAVRKTGFGKRSIRVPLAELFLHYLKQSDRPEITTRPMRCSLFFCC